MSVRDASPAAELSSVLHDGSQHGDGEGSTQAERANAEPQATRLRVVAIAIRGGAQALVDEDNYASLSVHAWSRAGSGGRIYARARAGYMHRIIVGAKPGQFVDHINGNPLDNRRANLRICTQSQNHANRKVALGRSRFKGVWLKRGLWIARVSLKKGPVCLGTYATEEDAARAYDNKLREIFGEFAHTNFSDVAPTPPTLRQRQGMGRACAVCGESIVVQPVGKVRQYCSARCKAHARKVAS
jgi:hypothetical protein